MQLPEHLTLEKEYARFFPQVHVTLEEGAALVAGAIEFCREQKIARLLVDISALSGIGNPTIVDRFWLVRQWAEKARGMVVVAMVAPPALIDARKFGMTVAHNLGLRSEVFTSTEAAVEWLAGGQKGE